MSRTLNMVGSIINSGTSLDANAYIVVEVTSGSTVTCTNSPQIIKLTNEMFLILTRAGVTGCTTTATLNGKSVSKQITGISTGDSYYIRLRIDRTYLYADQSDLSKWDAYAVPFGQGLNSKKPTFDVPEATPDHIDIVQASTSANYGGLFRIKTAVDLTNYKKLKITTYAKGKTSLHNYAHVVILDSSYSWWGPTNNTHLLANVQLLNDTASEGAESANATKEINVSTINQTAYIGIGLVAGSPAPAEVDAQIYECYLEPI